MVPGVRVGGSVGREGRRGGGGGGLYYGIYRPRGVGASQPSARLMEAVGVKPGARPWYEGEMGASAPCPVRGGGAREVWGVATATRSGRNEPNGRSVKVMTAKSSRSCQSPYRSHRTQLWRRAGRGRHRGRQRSARRTGPWCRPGIVLHRGQCAGLRRRRASDNQSSIFTNPRWSSQHRLIVLIAPGLLCGCLRWGRAIGAGAATAAERGGRAMYACRAAARFRGERGQFRCDSPCAAADRATSIKATAALRHGIIVPPTGGRRWGVSPDQAMAAGFIVTCMRHGSPGELGLETVCFGRAII